MRMRHLILALSTVAILGAVGCAGTPTQSEESRKSSSSVDSIYMHEVERRARRTGVHVHWVNPPRKSVRVQFEEAQEDP
jgi:hypothetical protein